MLALGAFVLPEFPLAGIILLTVGVAYSVFDVTAVIVMPVVAWRKKPELAADRFYAFSDEGVEVRAPTTDMMNEWSRYTRTLESRLCYLMRIGATSHYLYLPKRAFASEADELAFRTMAERYTLARFNRADSGHSSEGFR